jgi:hypothetical protein
MNNDMKPRLITVFFYGLFMDAEALRSNGYDPSNGRQACVSGMALQISQRATLVPAPDGRVFGFVMDLAHSEVDRLYAEPSVAAYRPEAVMVELMDGTHIAGEDALRQGPGARTVPSQTGR